MDSVDQTTSEPASQLGSSRPPHVTPRRCAHGTLGLVGDTLGPCSVIVSGESPSLPFFGYLCAVARFGHPPPPAASR
jgi:hypothetical protein